METLYQRAAGLDIHKTHISIYLRIMHSDSTIKEGTRTFAKIIRNGTQYFDDRVSNMVITNNARLLETFRKANMKVVYIVTWSETEYLSDMPKYHGARRTARKRYSDATASLMLHTALHSQTRARST